MAEDKPARLATRPRPSHRSRSSASAFSRKLTYMQPGGPYDNGRLRLAANIVEMDLPVSFPTVFATFGRDSQVVTEEIAKHWPTLPAALPLVSAGDDKSLLITCKKPTATQAALFGPGQVGKWLHYPKSKESIPLKDEELAALEVGGVPPYMAMHWVHVIPLPILKKLLVLFDALVAAGVEFPEADFRRSGTAALHLGVWSLYARQPRITADSHQTMISNSTQRARVVAAIDALCMIVKVHIVPKLVELMDEYVPGQSRVQNRIHERVTRLLEEDFRQRPTMDFGPVFYTMAVKEGSSERIHVDWNDNIHKYALIFCAGDYTGGEFCVPQLNIRIPLRPGAVLAVRTRLLAHCATLVGQGRRLVFTCFTDSTLLEQTLRGHEYALV
ncbi:hypothetical protein DFH07DRAFT_973849 [Mycena maculata]|uniref:Uncharacterized protein n=1 Tax=Mycena maculata TaxID=230809 RepID=A0AAD7MGS6_9AGAR|nr:hypothetical protein DFH07DRAFT_973849 [Mycena maculata]